MTEKQWLTMTDSESMSRFLSGEMKQSRSPSGRRKLRLYACACCRRAWELFDDERSKQAVEIAERYAEGNASREELVRMWESCQLTVSCNSICAPQASWAAVQAPFEAAMRLGFRAEAQMKDGYKKTLDAESRTQASLIRDIFGNPFRPVSFSTQWRTSTAVALAQQMYDSRDFSAMPILADALQDAGCDNADVLGHCRGPGPHVRGCWVVDLVLDKK
jgi:hypothetical protein